MTDAELKAAFLAARAAGVPTKDLVGKGKLTNSWRLAKLRDDSDFHAQIAAIDASLGRAGIQFVFDEKLKERILRAVRAGWNTAQTEPPASDIPTWQTIRKHKAVDPVFAADLDEALGSLRPQRKAPPEAKAWLSREQKAEILRRLAEGKPLTALGSDLPSVTRIRVHRRADAAFDAEVRAFIVSARPDRYRRFERTPELLDRIMDALREGRPLDDLGEDLPSGGTIRDWREDDPTFDAKVTAALEARTACSGGAVASRGDEASAAFESRKSREARKRVAATKEAFLARLQDGETVRASTVAVEGQGVIDNYLRGDPQFRRRYLDAVAKRRTASGWLSRYSWTEDRRDAVLTAIRAGASISRLGEGLPTVGALLARRRQDPELDRALQQAFIDRRRRKAAERKPKVSRPAPMPITFHLKRTNEIYAAANRAVSRSLPPFARDDIISEIVLSVLAGETAPNEIAERARGFTIAYNRMAESRIEASLDQQRSGAGDVSLYNLMSMG